MKKIGAFQRWSDIAVQEPERVPQLVDGILPTKGVVLLVGAAKVGKSRLLAGLIAAKQVEAQLFLGRAAHFDLAAGRPALYLLLEQQSGMVQLFSEAERGVGLGSGKLDLTIYTDPIQLVGVGAEFLDAVREIDPWLVVVDSIRRAGLHDEDRSADVSALMDAMAQLAALGAGRLVIGVHHPGHRRDGPRGSSDFDAAADGTLLVKERPRGVLTLTASYHRSEEDSVRFAIRHGQDGAMTVETERDASALFEATTPVRAEVAEGLKEIALSNPSMPANQVLDAAKKRGLKFNRQNALTCVKTVRGERVPAEGSRPVS